MPVTVVKTVKPSGGDYTSLAAAEAGEQRDLTAVDQIAQIDCYAMQDTTAVSIAGWTTDATRYVVVNVPTPERHKGLRATGYRIVASTGFGDILAVNMPYTRLQGIAASNAAASGNSQVYNITSSCVDVRVSDCIAYDAAYSYAFLTNCGTNVYFDNCIAMNCGNGNGNAAFHGGTGASYTAYLDNCAAVNCGVGFHQDDFRSMVLTNCYAGGNAGGDFTKTANATLTLTTCLSSDGSLGSTVAAFSTANFTNVTPGSEDLSLPAGSALIDAGTDLSTDPNWVDPAGAVDIIGTARPQGAAWDVGAFEYVAAGGTTVVTGIASTSAIGLVATRQKIRATGQPIEGDAGLAAGRIKQRQTGTPAVTNTGLTAGRSKVRTSGIAAVLSTAMQAHTVKIRTAGFAVEVDQALANAGRLVIQTGIALTAAVGLAAAVVKQRLTGQAVETDTAVTSRAAKLRVTGIAVVATQALSSTSRKIRTTAVAAETDIALAARVILGQFAGLAVTVRTLARGSGTGLTNVAVGGTGATGTARTSTGRTRSNLEGT